MANVPLRVAIVGTGMAAMALLRTLHGLDRIRVVGVAGGDTPVPDTAAAGELGVTVCADLRDLVRDADLDIIVLATPDPRVGAEVSRLKAARAVVVEGEVMARLVTLVGGEDDLLLQLRTREHGRDLILDSTHDGVLAVNSSGQITICNRAAERMLGVQREQILGREAAAVIPGTRLHKVLRTGEPELNQQQDLGTTTIVTNRVPVRDPAGRIIGAVAVFRDITEVKALAEEMTDLRETKALLEAIIHSTSDAISVVDEKGIQILVNPAYEALVGLRREQVIGRPATVDIEPGQESMLIRVLRTGEPVRKMPLKAGPRHRDVIVDCAPILVAGALKGAVGVVRDVSEILRLTEELEQQKSLVRRLTSKYTFDDIVAASAVMQEAVLQARRAAQTPATVLLRGESGTGKELFAHALHNASPRRDLPLTRVNCAAIPEQLLESELFGYEEGAFTGARKGGKPGLFLETNGGTLFLDEIGDLPLALQAKLLRVLQEKEVRPIGGRRSVGVDVRIIAATHANLEERMARAGFREDLYYRLNVLPIMIPPLRVRPEDFPVLVERVLDRLNREYGRMVTGITAAAMELLLQHPWPGNVRELENVIGRAMIHMDLREATIEPRHLPPLQSSAPALTAVAATVEAPAGRTLEEIVAQAERSALLTALAAVRGNKMEGARRLGIAPRTLYYKLQRYGLAGHETDTDL